MKPSFDMAPFFAIDNGPRRGAADAEGLGNYPLALKLSEGADAAYQLDRELSPAIGFAQLVRAVGDLISGVLYRRFPREVPMIDATSPTARVSSLVKFVRCWPANEFAYKPTDDAGGAAVAHLSVSITILGERPHDAAFHVRSEGALKEPLRGLTSRLTENVRRVITGTTGRGDRAVRRGNG